MKVRFASVVLSLLLSLPAISAAERQFVKTARIAAPVPEVWAAWTTPAGFNAFLGVDSIIELRRGGKYEIYFGPPALAPNRGSEGCTVLSYLPQRMLSFTWNVPPSFPALRALGPTTFVVIELSPAGEHATDLRLTHLGWPDGAEWDGPFAYFDKAWSAVLTELQKTKSPPPPITK